MLFASADGDRGYILVAILMIFGAVRIFNGAKKAAGDALKDEKTRSSIAGWISKLFK